MNLFDFIRIPYLVSEICKYLHYKDICALVCCKEMRKYLAKYYYDPKVKFFREQHINPTIIAKIYHDPDFLQFLHSTETTELSIKDREYLYEFLGTCNNLKLVEK